MPGRRPSASPCKSARADNPDLARPTHARLALATLSNPSRADNPYHCTPKRTRPAHADEPQRSTPGRSQPTNLSSMLSLMTDIAAVDQVLGNARRATPARVLLTVLLAIGVAVGWPIGRFLLAIGWAAGRVWLTGAYCVEAVIFGFKAGAKLPLKQPEEPQSR